MIIGEDLQLVRSVPMPFPVTQVAVVDWPRVVVVQKASNPSVDEPRLFVVDLSGTEAVVSDLPGGDDVAVLPQLFYPVFSLLTGSDGGLWVLEAAGYYLSHVDLASATVATWRRQAYWFEVAPWDVLPFVRSSAGPLMEGPSGRLWVAVGTPRSTARQALAEALEPCYPDGFPATPFPIDERLLPPAQVVYQTVIEVLDPESGRVYARSVLDCLVRALLPGGRAVFITVEEDDASIFRVASLRLVEPGL
jgi:hypothetical protein